MGQADYPSNLLLNLPHLRMSRFEAALEVRKRLYELSHIFAWNGIDGMPRAQVTHQTGEKALGHAYYLEREVRDVVAHARREAAQLVPEECTKIDVLQDEFGAFYVLVELSALRLKETCTATCFILREHKKSGEEYERNEQEDKICHGS